MGLPTGGRFDEPMELPTEIGIVSASVCGAAYVSIGA